MTGKRVKSAGIAAALLLSASSVAMATTLFVPTNGGVPVALELFGTPTFDPAAAVDNIRIESTGVNTFTNSEMRATFTFSNAKFAVNLTAANLTGDANTGFGAAAACAPAPVVTLFSGGTTADSTVTFAITGGVNCRSLRLKLGGNGLNNVSSGSPVVLTASLRTAAGTDIDGGVINSPLTYIVVVDANTGSVGTATTATINLATGGKNFVPLFDTSTATTFLSGLMNDKLAGAFKADLSTQWKNSTAVVAGGTLVLTGIPAAVTTVAPTISVNAAGTITGHGAGTFACTAPAGLGTSTCTFSSANMIAIIDAIGTSSLTALFTVNGTTTLVPATVNGKLSVTYAAGQTTPDVKFDGPIAIVSANACAADFGSIVGANPYGIISTIRLTNRSNAASKVDTVVTKEDGTSTAVLPLTQANTGINAGLNASNLLPAGGTLEVRGTTLETISGLSFLGPDGRSRARVRLFVETGAAVGGSVGSIGNVNGVAGCSAEGFLCTGSAACSITPQYGDGKDGLPVAQPNK